MIVADTSAMLALLNRDDAYHEVLLRWYEENEDGWILPWAILPEIDYLLGHRVHHTAQVAFFTDLAENRYLVEWAEPDDLPRALAVAKQYRALELGLVDTIIMATAERLRADAIATLDLSHFGAVKLAGAPLLLPRDG